MHCFNEFFVYPSRFVACKDEFECDFLFIFDYIDYRSKVCIQLLRCNFFSMYFIYRETWPETPYIKSIGYWVLLCYVLVFYCLLEYCVVLTLNKEYEDTRIQLATKIEKYSRYFVPIYLFSFVSLYFVIMHAI